MVGEECRDMGRGKRTVFCTPFTNLKKKMNWLKGSHARGQNDKKKFAELVHCVRTKISAPSHAQWQQWIEMLLFLCNSMPGEWRVGVLRTQVTGMI